MDTAMALDEPPANVGSPPPAVPTQSGTPVGPTGPFPKGFKPIILKDRDSRGWSRPRRAAVPVKAIRFEGNADLARLIEAKAQLEKVRINDLLLRLLRQGLRAESNARQP